jgi:hypothetical protein
MVCWLASFRGWRGRDGLLDSGPEIVPDVRRQSEVPIRINFSRDGDQNYSQRTFPVSRIIVAECRERTTDMSVKGEIKEAAGFVKEESHEHGKSPESKQKAQEGRDLRNEGRVEDGKAPKTTKPGTGHPEK